MSERKVFIAWHSLRLPATLTLPENPRGLVLFAHGSGSSRMSPRNRRVAAALAQAGIATLLPDLLTVAEEHIDQLTMEFRFDIGLLAGRVVAATEWVRQQPELADLPLGYFGASTGAAAALVAASRVEGVRAIVSRGGRVDLAGAALPAVRAPTLLIVGGADRRVLTWNLRAIGLLEVEKSLQVVPGASHLFEEEGAFDAVISMATQWFERHLCAPALATAQ